MGSVSTTAMVHQVMPDDTAKKVHPFFSKDVNPPHISAAIQNAAEAEGTAQSPVTDVDGGSCQKKRRKGDAITTEDTPVTKRTRRTRKAGEANTANPITNHLAKPPGAADDGPSDPYTFRTDFPTPPLSDVSATIPEKQVNESNAIEAKEPSGFPAQDVPGKAKKVLKFNPRTGTLGSPPKPKPKASRIVVIQYGKGDDGKRLALGQQIDDVLEGRLQLPEIPTTPTKRRQRGRPRKSTESTTITENLSTKITHPFFTGKKAPATAVGQAGEKKPDKRKHSIFTTTPISPRKPHQAPPAANFASFGAGFGQERGTRVPGAKHPAWPPQGMVHIRGNEGQDGNLIAQVPENHQRPRKSKGQVITIQDSESVLNQLVLSLNLESIRQTVTEQDASQFPKAPFELRIPARHFESGPKLQKRVATQLRTLNGSRLTGDPDEDELDNGQLPYHTAILRWYRSLETQLSAYDRSDCECSSWYHKYAPTAAEEVLQSGKEATLLKEWLETLKVQAVESNNADTSKEKGKGDKTVKKRRKNKLDGFVVDSGDEAYEMDEASDDDAEWAPAGPNHPRKTVVRSRRGKDQGRLPNAVLISGPHGCGKSATAHAVAKELGFEVFEIHAGSRRSGKDILERVGDMTRNHLVQQHQAETAAIEEEEDEVSKDLKSGKQGTMTTFFKPKPSAEPKKLKNKMEFRPKEEKSAKAQKQSLILLEEVDVLFEEDKQFWVTLISLMEQSKRPFIMTCNDESLVPIQTLTLYGILRFSPAPRDLAVDLCLLIAANEGHALKRHAVESLYVSRGHDLRATISTLNYWCQIGVGDRRGGFDWFYLRWPKGSDLDESGDVVRVISEDTYLKGMDWITHDPIWSQTDSFLQDDEARAQCWDSWQIAVDDWRDMSKIGNHLSQAKCSRSEQSRLIESWSELCDSLSDADLVSNHAFGTKFQETIDATLPQYPTKFADDYSIGRQVLEADPTMSYTNTSMELANRLSSQAFKKLRERAEGFDAPDLEPLNDDKAVALLESTFNTATSQLTRYDFALAFDPIAIAENSTAWSYLDPSVFDRNFSIITEDVAPWVRGIVSYDHKLMLERRKLSSLLSEGGQGKKRMRNTRAAYSALEGGERKTTRRDKYFRGTLNTPFVLATGLKIWRDAAEQELRDEQQSAHDEGSSPPTDQTE